MRQCFTVDCDLAHARASQISSDSPLRQTDDFHDLGKKRAMLEQLRNSPEVDVGLRTAAGERLARLGNGSAAFELALAISPDGGADAGAFAGTAEATLLASLMRSKKPDDYQKVRDMLEPKIYGGRATPDDVRMMTIVCKAEKDTACLKMLKTLVLH